MRLRLFRQRIGGAVGHLEQEGQVLRRRQPGDADVELGFARERLLSGTNSNCGKKGNIRATDEIGMLFRGTKRGEMEECPGRFS